MSSSKKIIVVLGATGNQGGSVIDIVLARQDLSSQYALRGVTRDTTSSPSRLLSTKGVEMVQANLDDVASLQVAMQGAYGVFGVTDFWSIMSKDKEIQQGKNIFHAAQHAGVKHLVFSALPYSEKLTEGKLKHVEHFDSKAIVKEYMEAHKGDHLITSYYLPAMFLQETKKLIRPGQGDRSKQLIISLPFPNDSIAWPLVDPRRDSGKYVLGLFEGGAKANGVSVHGVSFWTTPKDLVAAFSKAAGRDISFETLPVDVFASYLPDVIAKEISEMMDFIGNWNYYGKGQEKVQGEHDRWLVEGVEKVNLQQWMDENGPWEF